MFECGSLVMGTQTLAGRSIGSFEHRSPPFLRRTNMPQSLPLTSDGVGAVLHSNGNYEELSLIGNGKKLLSFSTMVSEP